MGREHPFPSHNFRSCQCMPTSAETSHETRPILEISGRSADWLKERGVSTCGPFASVSHDQDYATALVVLQYGNSHAALSSSTDAGKESNPVEGTSKV